MSEYGIDVGGRALEEVEEGAEVEVGLLVEEVHLSAVGLFGWYVIRENFGFKALGELIFELDLSIERVGRRPGLGQSQA